MILLTADTPFIYGGPALDLCLCASMLVKKRWLEFPALFSLVALDLLSSPVLYWISPMGNSRLYGQAYFFFDVASFVLQLLVLYEIARSVLKPTGAWVRGAVRPLVLIGITGALVAFLATLLLEPAGAHGVIALQLRAEVFTSLLASEIVVAMMMSAQKVGLPWRSHVMAVGQGLMFWSLVAATEEGVSVYLGPQNPYVHTLYYVRSLNYLATVTYWTVSLWHEEPERLPISPALRKYVVALHERVQYDLGKVGH